MDAITHREVSRPAQLKSEELDADDMLVLGGDQGGSVGTDLDGNAWPTQLFFFYDEERDATIVQPRGRKNKIQPYKLSGLIRGQDVYAHFHGAIMPPLLPPQDDDKELPLEAQASETSGSIVDPVAEAIDADEEEDDL